MKIKAPVMLRKDSMEMLADNITHIELSGRKKKMRVRIDNAYVTQDRIRAEATVLEDMKVKKAAIIYKNYIVMETLFEVTLHKEDTISVNWEIPKTWFEVILC